MKGFVNTTVVVITIIVVRVHELSVFVDCRACTHLFYTANLFRTSLHTRSIIKRLFAHHGYSSGCLRNALILVGVEGEQLIRSTRCTTSTLCGDETTAEQCPEVVEQALSRCQSFVLVG